MPHLDKHPSQDRLALLYRLSQTFNSSLDLDEVLNLVMDEVIQVMHAERGFVMLRGERGELKCHAARGIDHQTIEGKDFTISQGIVKMVAQNGQPVLTNDAQLDDRFLSHQSVRLHGLRSILCVPLNIKDSTTGVIYVDNRLQAGIFADGDRDLLEAIAANAAIAIENARLYLVAIEKGRMERELQVARQVQVSLLPQEMPKIAGWDFAATWKPAREVAGDFYDFFPVGEDHFGVVIADVADKGMPAALFMASSRNIVRASLNRAVDPLTGIKQANQLVCAESTRGMFVTLFYLLIDRRSNQVTYVNAGHNPPAHFHRDKGQISYLTRTGMALGVDEETPYEQMNFVLEKGDFIFFYTDGVIDALNEQSRAYGMERLEKVIAAMHLSPARELIAALEKSVGSFIGSSAPYDDLTIVMAKKL